MTPIRMDRAESAVRIVIKFIEFINTQDAEHMADLFSKDIIFDHFEPAPDGLPYSTPTAVVNFFEGVFQSHPTLKLEIEDLFGYGNRCILRWNLQVPEGSQIRICKRGLTLFQIRDDQITEILSYGKQ